MELRESSTKHDSRYWERIRERYALAARSLERQLESLDAFSAEWEECYSLLLDAREKAGDAVLKRYEALKDEPSVFQQN